SKLRQPPGRETAPGFLLRARKPRPRHAYFGATTKDKETLRCRFQKGESDDVRRPPPYPWTRAARCTPPVAKTSGHCFATVLYNENTNQDVWTRSCGDRAISRSAPMTVVPAQAGTYDHRSEIMGPRLRGDDGNKRRRSITPSAPRADPGFAHRRALPPPRA